MTINRDTATGTYSISFPGATTPPGVSFGGTGSTTTVNTSAGTTFIDHPQSGTNVAKSFLVSTPGTPTGLVLTYSGFGLAKVARSTTSNRFDVTAISFGQRTPFASRPTSGTASYSGPAYGVFTPSTATSNVLDVTGTSTMNIDFAASTFSTVLNLSAVQGTGLADLIFGALNGSGTVVVDSQGIGTRLNFTSFASAATTYGTTSNQAANGTLYGPSGTEYGYTFQVQFTGSGTNPSGTLDGVTAGK